MTNDKLKKLYERRAEIKAGIKEINQELRSLFKK